MEITKQLLEDIAGHLWSLGLSTDESRKRNLSAEQISKIGKDVVCLVEVPSDDILWRIDRSYSSEIVDAVGDWKKGETSKYIPIFHPIFPIDNSGFIQKKGSGLYQVEGVMAGYIGIFSRELKEKYLDILHAKESGIRAKIFSKYQAKAEKEIADAGSLPLTSAYLWKTARPYSELFTPETKILAIYERHLIKTRTPELTQGKGGIY